MVRDMCSMLRIKSLNAISFQKCNPGINGTVCILWLKCDFMDLSGKAHFSLHFSKKRFIFHTPTRFWML